MKAAQAGLVWRQVECLRQAWRLFEQLSGSRPLGPLGTEDHDTGRAATITVTTAFPEPKDQDGVDRRTCGRAGIRPSADYKVA